MDGYNANVGWSKGLLDPIMEFSFVALLKSSLMATNGLFAFRIPVKNTVSVECMGCL